jgi:acetyl-CoA acetyltransferase
MRTPVGSFGDQFKDVSTTELGAPRFAPHAVREASRAGLPAAHVDEVVLGCVQQAGRTGPRSGVAIALGHPIGASACGLRVVTLVREMRRRDSGRGVGALSIGATQRSLALVRCRLASASVLTLGGMWSPAPLSAAARCIDRTVAAHQLRKEPGLASIG